MQHELGIVWIRRDLRLHDHAALSKATQNCKHVILIFVFDTQILNNIRNKHDQRVSYIYQSLEEIESRLQKIGSSLEILHGNPTTVLPKIVTKFNADALFFNEDYTPYTLERDRAVTENLLSNGVSVYATKDSVIMGPNEILKKDGSPYKVFTPYKNNWIEKLSLYDNQVTTWPIKRNSILKRKNSNNILIKNWYKVIGFQKIRPYFKAGSKHALTVMKNFENKVDNYHLKRDFPAIEGTSNLSVAIRHGVISVRDMVRMVTSKNSQGRGIWLNEIIWREFYQMIVFHYPHVKDGAFRPIYNKIKWPGKDKDYVAWKDGMTGFPIVDAAMRCLKETGTMHNRLRMIVASFLCKTLLVDWKRGERYFARTLLDYDFASNNGGWQWCSSTGCDAQPYFRIFNPITQSKKFDKDGTFIKKHIPELQDISSKEIHFPNSELRISRKYPEAIVNYSENRKQALSMYKKV